MQLYKLNKTIDGDIPDNFWNVSDIIEYPNFFDDHDYQAINREVDAGLWKFGHYSASSQKEIPFWLLSLSKSKFFSEYLLNKIESHTGFQFNLERVYGNGQTYGMKGFQHYDSLTPTSRTLLYYPMPRWDVGWGGKTCFKIPTKDGLKNHFVVPEPNKAVLFPAAIPHWAEETSRVFTGLRVTIAWKLELK